MPNLKPLQDIDDLQATIAESRERPVLLFKHSRSCCKLITVQSHRNVSDAAADRFGVRHETPQAIRLRDGRVVWSASHFQITARELSRILGA